MALALKPGTELRLRVSTAGKAGTELLRLRITQTPKGYDLGLLSGLAEIEGRVIGKYPSECEVWAAVAILASTWPDSPALPVAAQYELAMLLVVHGAGKVLTSLLYPSSTELWAGMADYAAGRQADIALAMIPAQEEHRGRGGRDRQ